MEKIDLAQISIQRFQDFELSQREREELRELLKTCFPEFFTHRIYHKQIPSFRLLCKTENQIIGHVSITCRVISIQGEPFEIFGFTDLCTDPRFRHQGVAAQLIGRVLALAKRDGIDHIFLFTDEEHTFYEKFGFQAISAQCRWLAIEKLTSHSILERDVSDILMVYTVTPSLFENQNIDLLGELF